MTVTVTGGVVTYDGDYTIRTFEIDGTLEITGGTLTNVDYLLIACGGPAPISGTYRAGGGAGGVIQAVGVNLSAGKYEVRLGDTRKNATFAGNTAIKGGAGGFQWTQGVGGGSGGGSAVAGDFRHPNFLAGPGTPGQGFPGGNPGLGGFPPASAGGGGGAGQSGVNGGIDYAQPGAGGDGIQSAITGTLRWYAGGGGAYSGGVFAPDGRGCDNYGGGGGYGTGRYVQPKLGVLIVRYPTI